MSSPETAEGLAGTGDYLPAFGWSDDIEQDGTADDVADAVVVELAARWGRTPDGRRLVAGAGHSNEKPG